MGDTHEGWLICLEVHDDGQRNSKSLRFGDGGCRPVRAEVEVPAVGVQVEAPTGGRGEPLRMSEERRRYGWLVGGGAAFLASACRCPSKEAKSNGEPAAGTPLWAGGGGV